MREFQELTRSPVGKTEAEQSPEFRMEASILDMSCVIFLCGGIRRAQEDGGYP